MNKRIAISFIKTAVAVSVIWAAGEQAKAATFKAITPGTTISTFVECINDGIVLNAGQNPTDSSGWQYAIDSFYDGVQGTQVGGNVYEIHRLGIRETADSIWVALNANMPLTGHNGTSAVDGNIGWGDLFLNFSGLDFTTASNLGRLFSVRFAPTNDSFAPTIGLYGNVTATSVTNINSGFSSLLAYNQQVSTYCPPGQICGPSLGDLPANTPYFDQTQSLNTTGSGTFLSSITYLSTSDLQAGGYNFNLSPGSQTIAFKFDKAGICATGVCEEVSVPEPSIIAGLTVLGVLLSSRKRKLAD
jgi:hypothetical protein